MKTLTGIAWILFDLTVLSHLNAQVRDPADSRREQDLGLPSGQSLPVFYEAINLPAEDPSKSRVDIAFSISYSFFIFIRNERFSSYDDTSDETRRWPFFARAEIAAELLDKSGLTAAREISRKQVGSANPERSARRPETIQGIFSFSLPPGDYTVVFQVTDLESNQTHLDKSKTVILRRFTGQEMQASDVVFVEASRGSSPGAEEFRPVTLGGDVFFGRDFDAYLEIVDSARAGRPILLSYSLYTLDQASGDSTFVIRDSVLQGIVGKTKILDIHRTDSTYAYVPSDSLIDRRSATLLPISGDRLRQGPYELRMTFTDGLRSCSVTRPFRVRWMHRPRSLTDLELAIDAVEHIATKDEFSELKSPFAKRRGEKFDDFWKKRDPTQQTEYNEAMAEYYRRVDHALENFSTTRHLNGQKSDRGKVYILYGQPANTERKFSPTSPPREIWTYDNLKKRFIFLDEDRGGDYKLVATENLP